MTHIFIHLQKMATAVYADKLEGYQHITHYTPQDETVQYGHQHFIVLHKSYPLL